MSITEEKSEKVKSLLKNDSGYVYLARIIDHSGKFVNGYHKIGKSVNYKVRETQLNSTHLPFDVLMIRVFKTDNQSNLEKLLHTCFEDYRVVKEYDDRRNITTEWFDVSDIDILNDRIETVVECIKFYSKDTKEIDLESDIKADKDISEADKVKISSNIERAKSSKVVFKFNNTNYSMTTGSKTYVSAIEKIVDIFGIETVSKINNRVAKNIEDIKSEKTDTIVNIKDYYIGTNLSNNDKVRRVKNLIDTLNIKDIEFYIEQ